MGAAISRMNNAAFFLYSRGSVRPTFVCQLLSGAVGLLRLRQIALSPADKILMLQW